MANYAYERLSAQDASFLLFETPNEHMHLAWLWTFEPGPLSSGDGGVDIERIRRHVASHLHRFPRFRQKLAYTPVERHPVWIDDASFKIPYHVQHVSLPDPGDDVRLWGTASALVSQPLDFSKPLWELWVIEGLAGGGFAVLSKTHHCMIDGVASVDLMTGLLDERPDAPEEEPRDWIPRPAPATSDLLFDTIRDRAALAASFGQDFRSQLGGLRDAITGGIARAPDCAINQPIGPHRLANGTRFPRASIEAAAARLGGTVDDGVLAIISGALRAYLTRQSHDPSAGPLRVAMPAGGTRSGATTNQAAAQIIELPVHLANPADRVRALVETRRDATAPSLDRAGGWLRFAEAAGHVVLGLGVGIRRWLHSFNLIVSVLPGPDEPRYLVGSKLVEAYPQIPLFHNQALGVGVARYLDHLHVAVVADWEIVPDLVLLIADLRSAYDELVATA